MTDTQSSQTLWLILANAFMPPMQPEHFVACRDFLADDLEGVCADLGLDVSGEILALRERMAGMESAQDLLVDFSHLFLQPPIPAALNLGRYVDGSLNGPCLDALENAYQAARVQKRDTVHDLGDNAAIQMECLAFLNGEPGDESGISAEEFAQVCLVGALPRLAATIDAESPESPYGPLANIAALAITRYAQEATVSDSSGKRANRRHDTSVGVWRHCKSCGKPFAREKEIQVMIRALQQAGLPGEHLALCPDCRDAVKGFFTRSIM